MTDRRAALRTHLSSGRQARRLSRPDLGDPDFRSRPEGHFHEVAVRNLRRTPTTVSRRGRPHWLVFGASLFRCQGADARHAPTKPKLSDAFTAWTLTRLR
jgi:hypothetical protein